MLIYGFTDNNLARLLKVENIGSQGFGGFAVYSLQGEGIFLTMLGYGSDWLHERHKVYESPMSEPTQMHTRRTRGVLRYELEEPDSFYISGAPVTEEHFASERDMLIAEMGQRIEFTLAGTSGYFLFPDAIDISMTFDEAIAYLSGWLREELQNAVALPTEPEPPIVQNWTPQNSIAGHSHTVGLTAGGTVLAVGRDYGDDYLEVSGWTNIVAIATGWTHTVGLRENGTVVAVGMNNFGQLDVSGWTDIIAIDACCSHTIGLRADGTVIAVGDNWFGQLNVDDWVNIINIAVGQNFTLGLRADGTVAAVGLGLNVDDWTDIVAITARNNHALGLREDGTVLAVGLYWQGQLDVKGWTNIVAIAAGMFHTIGLRADGAVVIAGNDVYGASDILGWSGMMVFPPLR